MKKTGLLAITLILAGCASQGGTPGQESTVTRYLCNKADSVAYSQEGQEAGSEHTYSCTREEFEGMNKVYDSMEDLKKSL